MAKKLKDAIQEHNDLLDEIIGVCDDKINRQAFLGLRRNFNKNFQEVETIN